MSAKNFEAWVEARLATRHQRLRSGRPLLAGPIVLAAAAALASPAFAQHSAIAECDRTTTTEAERTACLEAVINAYVPSEAPAPPATETAATPEASNSTSAPTETADAPDASPDGRRGLFSGLRLPFSSGEGDPAPTDEIVASNSPEAEEFGAAEAARATGERSSEAESRPRLVASVADAREAPYKRLEVELDNGQVWIQAQSEEPWDALRYDAPTEVEIWESRFGDYRMRLVGQDVTLRVTRVR